MEGFYRLVSYFQTQSEPAFCGLASLSMVLNALAIDPGRKWKGIIYMVNCIQFSSMVNRYNKMSQLINHPLIHSKLWLLLTITFIGWLFINHIWIVLPRIGTVVELCVKYNFCLFIFHYLSLTVTLSYNLVFVLQKKCLFILKAFKILWFTNL
jgi:hypothetical protein